MLSGGGSAPAPVLSHSASSPFTATAGSPWSAEGGARRVTPVGVPPSSAGPSSAPVPTAPAIPVGVTVVVRDLSGGVHELVCAPSDTVLSMKRRLEPLSGVSAVAQTLVFRGRTVADHETSSSLSLTNHSLLHLVKCKVNLDDVFTETSLRANCKYCHEPGAKFSPRPKCGRCDSEAVLISEGSLDPRGGRTRWRDLLTVRVSCPACGDSIEDKNPANIGFLCLARVAGKPCPSRVLRSFQYVFRQSHPNPQQHLQETLNSLFGYAHGHGLEDVAAS